MKPTMKDVTIDNHNEELVNFAQTIDFAPLFKYIKEYSGVECDFNQPKIATSNYGVHVGFASNDITEQAGIFAKVLRNSYIHSFNSGVRKDKNGAIFYYVDVNIRYEQKTGGSNGLSLFRAWYNESNGWIFN